MVSATRVFFPTALSRAFALCFSILPVHMFKNCLSPSFSVLSSFSSCPSLHENDCAGFPFHSFQTHKSSSLRYSSHYFFIPCRLHFELLNPSDKIEGWIEVLVRSILPGNSHWAGDQLLVDIAEPVVVGRDTTASSEQKIHSELQLFVLHFLSRAKPHGDRDCDARVGEDQFDGTISRILERSTDTRAL